MIGEKACPAGVLGGTINQALMGTRSVRCVLWYPQRPASHPTQSQQHCGGVGGGGKVSPKARSREHPRAPSLPCGRSTKWGEAASFPRKPGEVTPITEPASVISMRGGQLNAALGEETGVLDGA